MSRLSNLFDKLRSHLQQASTVVTSPFKYFNMGAATISSALGLILSTPFFLAMASKEIALAFTQEGDVTLQEKLDREENDGCILNEGENKFFQTYICLPTSIAGVYLNKAFDYPYNMLVKLIAKLEDFLKSTGGKNTPATPDLYEDDDLALEDGDDLENENVSSSTAQIYNGIDANSQTAAQKVEDKIEPELDVDAELEKEEEEAYENAYRGNCRM